MSFKPSKPHTDFDLEPFVTTFELSDIQGGALAAIFFQGSNALHAPWVITGVFLRACMDHGAHREQVPHRYDIHLRANLVLEGVW